MVWKTSNLRTTTSSSLEEANESKEEADEAEATWKEQEVDKEVAMDLAITSIKTTIKEGNISTMMTLTNSSIESAKTEKDLYNTKI